ncbi:glycerol-3-phosphate dehydrogenase GlpD [Methyloglobulus morosus KoM1]|uniref:Glycerol-3-phosphate dehydrogenase GlpD n=1 Tax=Methyloglobulus morosus KoM1 TaxID=1116472 RepID=V5CAZ8_9GAMM|nr:glycerol-3-phosphate dehydrogenase/oxidase [Methyloglobulus morosus]ESS73988.1 glycerol-3-phosphate dehydrogenase GlpD [Methyloglobulus morosus KoM1]
MQRDFKQLKNRKFDVLVCGGGIYGAWTAYDAALRGLKVALVDKGDWASATSSASSKLIHGGLRYLETFNFKLVKKSLTERRMLLQTAPHRVWPLRFGIPVYKNSRIGAFRLKCGLALYDFLAGDMPKTQAHQYHSKDDFIKHFPCLDPMGLMGGFTYFDAQTDDARFVLELIDGAISAGAVCVSYCEATELIEQNGIICGAVLQDKVNDEALRIEASLVVDTTGRWSVSFQNDKGSYRLTKGIHLIMPKTVTDEALLLTAQSDGRVFFVIPWYGLTLLGTTDTNYEGDIDKVTITSEDIGYLLGEANHVLKTTHWTGQDIIGKFAGIRVLQQSQDKNPSNLSRDWALKTSPNGLLSSIGGKFTSAREDSAIIVDVLCNQLGKPSVCQTFGKTFPWLTHTDYPALLDSSLLTAEQLGIDNDSAVWLVRRHGNRITEIFQLCTENPALVKRIRPELPFIMADFVFCAKNEMTIHLEDLLRRRIPLLILAKLSPDEFNRLANNAAAILSWDADKTQAEIAGCLQNQDIDWDFEK